MRGRFTGTYISVRLLSDRTSCGLHLQVRYMETILVVDDEPNIASFVSRALTAHGYLVDTAADGMQGFRLACERAYDLIVLDLLLPGLDGISVLARLMELRPGQPVFVPGR